MCTNAWFLLWYLTTWESWKQFIDHRKFIGWRKLTVMWCKVMCVIWFSILYNHAGYTNSSAWFRGMCILFETVQSYCTVWLLLSKICHSRVWLQKLLPKGMHTTLIKTNTNIITLKTRFTSFSLWQEWQNHFKAKSFGFILAPVTMRWQIWLTVWVTALLFHTVHMNSHPIAVFISQQLKPF